MKKLIAALFASVMLLAMFGVVSASADPGPNGNNNHGLCTAYFNGQKVGHDKHGDPGPFQALEDEAANNDGVDNDGDGETDEGDETIDDSTAQGDLDQAAAVFDYCNGLIGGNPEHGRYDCSTDDNGDTSCTRNEKPGNGPKG